MTTKKILKTTLVNLAIVACTTLIVFGIAELIVRSLYFETTNLFPRYHTDATYGDFTLRRIRPNAVFWHTSVDGSWKFTTNNKGFRNYVDYDYAKPANVVRIISLGDSHTQGYEVRQDYTYSAVAERYLERSGYDAQVLNSGVSGFSTAEALVFLENEGVRYDPDVVMLGFYRNDLEDNIKASLFSIGEDGVLSIGQTRHVPGVAIQNFIYSLPGVKWLSENSYFYSVLFNATWAYFKRNLSRTRSERIFEYAIATQDQFSNYQLELAARLFERMFEYCRDRGIRLIIIDVPAPDQTGGVSSSVPEELMPTVLANSDAFIDSRTLFRDLGGVAEIHVPHGARHISEFSHTLIGVESAKAALRLIGPAPSDTAPE